MILIRSLHYNDFIIELNLPITLCKDEIKLVTEEAEMVNSLKKLSDQQVVNFHLEFWDPQEEFFDIINIPEKHDK